MKERNKELDISLKEAIKDFNFYVNIYYELDTKELINSMIFDNGIYSFYLDFSSFEKIKNDLEKLHNKFLEILKKKDLNNIFSEHYCSGLAFITFVN